MIRTVGQAVMYYRWCIPFSVDGNPTPSIRWQFDQQDLLETQIIYTQLFPEDVPTTTTVHGCLILDKPSHFFNGNYTLLVANALGSASCTTYQHFMDLPDPNFQEEEPFHGTRLCRPRLLRPDFWVGHGVCVSATLIPSQGPGSARDGRNIESGAQLGEDPAPCPAVSVSRAVRKCPWRQALLPACVRACVYLCARDEEERECNSGAVHLGGS